MKKISDRKIIMTYIQKYELDKIFKVNILEHMELVNFSSGETKEVCL